MSSDAVQEAMAAVDRYTRFLKDNTTREIIAGLKLAARRNMEQCLVTGIDPVRKLGLEAEARVYLQIAETPEALLIKAWQNLYAEDYVDNLTKLLNPAGLVEEEE